MRDFRVRPVVFGLVVLPVAGFALALTVASAGAEPPFAATASVSNSPQYLGDTAGTAFSFLVTNTGTDTAIGAVEIERPSTGWSLTSCGAAPAGWSVQTADPKCRYRSSTSSADDLLPGQSRTFTVTATTAPGTVNRVGTWHVTVSKSNQFDQPSLLTAAEASQNGLQTTAYTWEVLDAVVSDSAVAPGSACPPSDKDELTSATVTMVVCGRNHATVPLTPTSGYSSLGGSFLSSSGTFSTGQIPANSAPVVVANWSGSTVVGMPGQNLTVVVTIGSAGNQTSPVTTLTGYEAINVPPTAADDAYSVAEDGALSVPAPGVLDNDSDPENQPITAQLVDGPAHAASFALNADGSFDYTPVADYAGADSFTYNAHDGIQASSSPATVTLTVTAVNDAPVNTAPSSVTTDEDTAYVFAPGALSVSDVDSGAGDVETTFSVTGATLTVGTTGVTVTGNGTGDVTVTGPVTAVAAAVDGATLTPLASGSTMLTMSTSDLGNTGTGGALTDTDVIAVSIVAVNDAPSFTAGPDQTVDEDAGAQSVPNWATAISAGPGEGSQTVTFEVTNDNAALFQTAPAVSSSGTLTYQANPDANGVAEVTVVLRDDGGTANGGDDTSEPATFTITVNAVNDAPSAANTTRTAQANMAIHVTGLLAGASDTADAGQSGYVPSFTLGSVTAASCAGCGISNVNADGSFDFAPPAGQVGSFTVNYTVVDSGYPAPGVTSAPATITVTVQGPVIWFVDPSVAGPGTGTLTDPFKALSSATAVATGAGDRIFVSSGTVTGNVTQPNGGWLIGQGVSGTSFDSVFGITPPAGTVARPAVNGTPPTVQGGISVAAASVVRGLNVAPPAGTAGITALGDNGVTVSEVGVTSAGARAVDVTGSQGVTFALTSVSSTGAPNGIRLNTVNTTTAGSFSVAGGTIAGSTAEGVFASAVGGLSLTDLTVSGSATHGMSIANASGTVALTRVTVFGSASDNARVFGSSGTVAVNVTDSTFRDNSTTTGNRGLLVQADGSATVTYTGSGNDYLRNRSTGLALRALSSQKMTTSETGGVYTQNGAGVDMVSNSTGGMAYSLTNGTATGCASCGVPVNAYKATGGTGTGANAMAGTISGMTVSNADSSNAPGIWVRAEGSGAHRAAVTGNTVSGVSHYGIDVAAGNGSATMDATVANNTVTLTHPDALSGVEVEAGTLPGDTVAMCADVRDNVLVSPYTGVQVGNYMAASTFRLPGYAGGATDATAVELYLTTRNVPSTAVANVGTAGFTGGAACATP